MSKKPISPDEELARQEYPEALNFEGLELSKEYKRSSHRSYNKALVSNKLAIGECIEWVAWIGDTDEGPARFYQMGRIRKITPWTVFLEIDYGNGHIEEKRLSKGFLGDHVDNNDLQTALHASLDTIIEKREAKRKQHLVDPSTPGAQQCFLCGQHYSLDLSHTNEDSSVLHEICKICHTRLKRRVSGYSSEAYKQGGQGGLKISEWLEILKISQGYCAYCNNHVSYSSLIIEHIKPLSLGGNNTIENIIPACVNCNSSKGPRDYETWKQHLQANHLLEQLQQHLGLSKFETIRLAIKHLAIHEGLWPEREGDNE